MDQRHTVVCTTCGRDAVVNRAPNPGGIWRCSECGGVGVRASATSCVSCGTLVPAARLAAIPSTNRCVTCADKLRQGPAFIAEPLGSREDFKGDRSSWRR